MEALLVHEQKQLELKEKQRMEDESYQASGVSKLLPNSKWKIILKKHKEGSLLQMAAARRVKKKFIPTDEDPVDQLDLEAQLSLSTKSKPSGSSSGKMGRRTWSVPLFASIKQPADGEDSTFWKQVHHCTKHTWLWITDSFPPADLTTVEASDESLACYLYVYCDVVGLDALPHWYQWVLRYYTIDSAGFHSVSAAEAACSHNEQCEIFDLTFVTGVQITDLSKYRFSVSFEDEAAPPVQFGAPSLGVMKLAVERLTRIINSYRSISAEKRFAKASAAE